MPGWVAPLESSHHEPAQECGRGGTVQRCIIRKLWFAQRKGKGAAFGKFEAMREQLGLGGKERFHFGWRSKMEIIGQALFGMLLAEQRERANALHDVVLPSFR